MDIVNNEFDINRINKANLESMDKKQIIEIAKQILVLMSKESGYGFGVCTFGNMIQWSMMKPKKDWGSILGTKAPLERYTKDELIKMLLFAKKVTENYDKYFRVRAGANIVILDKENYDWDKENKYNRWKIKYLSWYDMRFFDTLDEAIEYFVINCMN